MLNEQNSPIVRDKIVKASRNLFIQKGFKGTTVRDIAAASGTNVAMVNYYFRSKHNLFNEIFEEVFDTLAKKIFLAIDSDLPFFEMIKKWVYSYYDTLSEFPQLPIFLMNELNQNPRSLQERLMSRNLNKIYSKLAKRISEEEEKGTIKETSVTNFILNLVSLSVFPFVFQPVAIAFLNMTKEEYDELSKDHKEYVVEFIINAIKKN